MVRCKFPLSKVHGLLELVAARRDASAGVPRTLHHRGRRDAQTRVQGEIG